MRIHVLALAVALIAQPAWAHHKLTHLAIGATTATPDVAAQPCAVGQGPRQSLDVKPRADQCQRLLEQLRAAPENAELHALCDRAAKALTGRSCNPSVTS